MRNWLKCADSLPSVKSQPAYEPAKPGQLQSGNHVIIGSDVVALYPSLDTETTAECVREETIKSDINTEGVNWKEATRYIAVNVNKFEARRMGVSNLVPGRKFTKGATPGIRGADSKSGKDTTDVKWIHKRDKFSEVEEKKILGAVLKIGQSYGQGNVQKPYL